MDTMESGPQSPETEGSERPAAPSGPIERAGRTMPAATLENVPIEIAVELERTSMTMAELRRLSVGSVLPFSGAFDAQITVTANGARFASGELVRIGERTGVRLSRLD